MPSKGHSVVWQKQQEAAYAAFRAFCEAAAAGAGNAIVQDMWLTLDEDELCRRVVYEQFVYYMTFTARVNSGRTKGEHYKPGTIAGMIGILLAKAQERFRTSQDVETVDFLKCLGDQAHPSLTWLRGLKQQNERGHFDLTKKKGIEPKRTVAPPVYRMHVKSVSKAYSRSEFIILLFSYSMTEFSSNLTVIISGAEFFLGESARRRLTCLSAYQGAGRSSEIAFTTFDQMEYDPLYRCLFPLMPMFKVHRMKLFAFVAALDREMDWFLAFSDVLMFSPYNMLDPTHVLWIFPWLKTVQKPGGKIGKYFKDLLMPADGAGNGQFSRFAVESLPDQVSAQGLRSGFINEGGLDLTDSQVRAKTGHEARTGESAMFNYIVAQRITQGSGSLVMGGVRMFFLILLINYSRVFPLINSLPNYYFPCLRRASLHIMRGTSNQSRRRISIHSSARIC